MSTRAFIEDRLEEILPTVSKPGRYTGGELNSITKDHAEAEAKYVIAFPDAYEIGMSNLACSIIYHMLNLRADCVAERVYAPWPDMDKAMRQAEVPLFTLETRTPCADYDLWGFALSFELAYTNVLNMLDLAGVPVRSLDRDAGRPDGSKWPIIFAGGHCTFNPEPMAPFIDVFVIGEAESVLPQMTETFKQYRDLPREELVHALEDADRMRGDDVRRRRTQVVGGQALENFMGQPVGGGERKVERCRIRHASPVQVRSIDPPLFRERLDLRRGAVHQDDADVQRPEQRHVQQQRREVVVRDDGAVNREDEGLFAELRDVLQDAPQIGQLHISAGAVRGQRFPHPS